MAVTLTLAISANDVTAQRPINPQGTIAGTVSDAATGEPRSSVAVLLVGTTRGAMTDDAGRFSVADVPAGSYTVRARQLGYRPVELAVSVRDGVTLSPATV